ncbi:hypothetical protein IFM89_025119 [Coptis chinensis]|uniref:Synergin gamma C-terminal domain-containing protein n=1 Tax=Coptis chinensis TaxID=261450 RepID=A0A835LT03_9MAGN|nr:hypothetical protein IFM89_025119 [Coptis chinensis]
MAEKEEEEEDDEIFGDFVQNSKRNTEGEDWGDFMDTFSQPQKNSLQFENTWEKPKGALPLSLFGDIEEELQSDLVVNSVSNVKNGSEIKVENIDEDDDWEFKDAVSETLDFEIKKVDNIFDSWVIPETPPPAATVTTNSVVQESFEGSLFGFSNNERLDGDWFFPSEGNSQNPREVENGFHFESGVSTAKDSGSHSQPQQIATENGRNTSLVTEDYDSDGSFSDFKDAFPTTEALDRSFEQKEESNISDQSGVEMKDLSANGIQGNGKESDNIRGALPLSIFSDGKQDSDEPLHVLSYKPTLSVKNGINSQISSPNLSLNDLIYDLYSKADNVPSIGSPEHTGNGSSLDQTGLKSDLANVDDDFDESSWEFRGAPLETEVESSFPLGDLEYLSQKLPTESEITSFAEFYSSLKEESSLIILHHIDGLKSAQKVAELSGEDAKAEALHKEIQTACKKLFQENMVSEEVYLKEHPPTNVVKLLAAMEEPNFQVLESEYQLSHRISLAAQNLTSAIWLLEHALSVIKILNLGAKEDHFNYATTWSRMVSVCAQELKHGAIIWKQSLQRNLDKQILSKSQGQQYILAIGEIYRVVKILRVSVTLYKPWILSTLPEHLGIFASLEECMSIWSESGLDDALWSLSHTVGSGCDGSGEALLESLKSIHNLIDRDVLSLQNISPPESTCRLSLMSLKMVPDMKSVVWNGKHYFLTLANLWANLISRDPPKLALIPVFS